MGGTRTTDDRTPRSARWAAPENRQPFSEIAHAALRDLQASATTLGAGADVRA
jgi:hypothetical protein